MFYNFAEFLHDDIDSLPLIDEKEDVFNKKLPKSLSILPLRNTVLFPGVVIPITIGRPKSLKLVKEINKKSKIIGVVAQKNNKNDNLKFEDLYKIGTIAKIIKIIKMPNGKLTAIIQGKKAFKMKNMLTKDPYIQATIVDYKEDLPNVKTKRFIATIESIKEVCLKIIRFSPEIPSEAQLAIDNIDNNVFLINFVCSNMNLNVTDKQILLEEKNIEQRAKKTLEKLLEELHMLEMKNEIQSKVKTDLDKQQREYFLNQQLKTIKEELGSSSEKEIDELKSKSKLKKWNKDVGVLFDRELKKLNRMNPAMADYSIHRSYLEFLLDLPWGEFTEDKYDFSFTKKVLEKDHYGMDKVKKRILEYLAVLKLKSDMDSPIICLYGPPGVGKTSLGKSIADSLGRKFIRMSLGGLRDEAEIRGHRKTYIGAMPGRIVKSINRAGSANPVFVLDEIDKVANDFRGDPSSALLEVLDPEQNNSFYDNYLEMGFDLSKVLFIATANNISNIHPALLDRMELIEINGYTIEEKIQIFKKHLLPKQLIKHGLKSNDFKLENHVIEFIITDYTRESGVRKLEKIIASILRYLSMKIVLKEDFNRVIDKQKIKEILGPVKYQNDYILKNNLPGVVVGLAWTSVGGDILFIESTLSKGKGKLTLTGNLGDVMKESANIALEFLKSKSDKLNIQPEVFSKWNVHIHVPEGATPKDGPSAGLAMFIALVSLFTQRKVKSKIAMTGEITLRGKILPVGGIKEKILAAKRAGIKEIILCSSNKNDISLIKQKYIRGLKIHYIDNMLDVINIAINKTKVSSYKKIV